MRADVTGKRWVRRPARSARAGRAGRTNGRAALLAAIAPVLAGILVAAPLLAETGLGGGVEVPVRESPAISTPDSRDDVDLARARRSSTDSRAGGVELDRLLKLPSGMTFENETRGGATEEQWRTRFREGRAELQQLREALADSERQLDQMASGGVGSTWQVAPPGSKQAEIAPLSFKLREEIRAGRERLEQAQRRLRELEVEADLAGVPRGWRSDSD